jgi:hypothetical protein
MASAALGDSVHRMVSRQTSSLFASLLVLSQLLVSPFAHASPAVDEDCGPTRQSTHAATAGMTDCGGCPDGQASTPSGTSHDDHHCRTHAACASPCAHTPALGAIRLFVASPSPPESAVTDVATPAFDSPLFDFLRPPN